ncbi:MAG: diguanylate cyclase [Clostridia bacterium]|nr:diguanylate cyclase [Clostridia bacterium]
MKERFYRIGNALKHIGIRSLVLALVVLLITAGLATFVGIRISATEWDAVQSQGKLNAREAAIEYDRCLLTRVNIVTLVGHQVEHMLQSGTANDAIEEYLSEQTHNIIATLDPSTTGLYGWINREYLDGAGWVPDADYVPVERPWYVETMASDQEITFIEPYLDMQTNTVMMTVTDLMSDGESVVAMDVSLEPIQKIIEQVASGTEGSQAFVLDLNGTVVAHSDVEQLGRNYLNEPDSLGGAVAQKILRDRQMQFDLKVPEGFYSVYVDKLEGGWYSVSMINADIWYRPLRRAMIIFFVILSLVVIFLVSVFLRLSAKNLALQRLHTRIRQEETRRKELKALSETDRMTGLYDRVNGERQVEELLAENGIGMFVELDIDDFKAINDTYGHQAGDRAIQFVADSLRSTFRTNDVLIRLGGDEFGVFAIGVTTREMGDALIHRLFRQLSNNNIPELSGKKISISVGAVIHSGEKASSFGDLYAAADSAMYHSKKRSGNSLTFSE